MSNFTKHFILLLTLLFSFAGKSIGGEIKVLSTLNQPTKQERSQANLSESKSYLLLCLQRGEEQINLVSNAPAPPSKNHSDNFYGNFYASELIIKNIVRQFILHSSGFERSLTVGDIIFPSHYFW